VITITTKVLGRKRTWPHWRYNTTTAFVGKTRQSLKLSSKIAYKRAVPFNAGLTEYKGEMPPTLLKNALLL
jgi:hypothetical protein